MIEIPISDIEYRGLVIPGGWRAQVIEVYPEDAAFDGYVPGLMAEGLAREAAERRVVEIIQRKFNAGFVHGLRASIRNYAHRYAQQYPELVATDGTLRGFQPERLQHYYLPYSRSGEPTVDELLAEMAEAAR